jgi:hypothetical protein
MIKYKKRKALTSAVIFVSLSLLILYFGCVSAESNLSILSSDFNDEGAQNWVDDGSDCWAFSDSTYVMTGNKGDAWRLSFYDQTFCDFEFQADMRKISGDPSGEDKTYGISFRYDRTNKNHYSFLIAKSGQYSIGKLEDGRWIYIKEWTESPALNAGFDQWNTLKVVAQGSTLEFYANSVLLDTIQDTAFSCGLVCLRAFDDADSDTPDTVQFDNVRILIDLLPAPTSSPTIASKVITTNEEGTVEHPSGAKIYVPLGAVPENAAGEEGEMLFTIEEGSPEEFGVPSTPPPDWEFVGDINSMGPEGFIFEVPITVTMPLPEGFDHGQYDVCMFDYDRVAKEWVSIGGRVNEDGTALSVDVLHLCANILFAQQWSDKGHGAIMFNAVPKYSFKLCIENFTLKYPNWDATRFDANNRFRSIIRRDVSECPHDGKQYWRLPQGTYDIAVMVYYHREEGVRPEYLGYYQRTIIIDRPHWDWQSGGNAPDYEFAVPFSRFETNLNYLTSGRPSCRGTSTASVGIGAINVRLDWRANADLDLWVYDPCNNKIYFDNTSAKCQGSEGQLDLDNQCADFVLGRPENIFWKNNPPRGKYKVYVDYYEDCENAGAVRYTVTWLVSGKAYSESETIQPPSKPGAEGDEDLVTTFEY